MLEITVERHDGYVLCRPAGELDAYTVAQFREALTDLAVESFVLVDLSDVPFMDSAGLGALIGGIRRARENNGDVAVACNRPALTRLLHTTGFDRIVPVRETLEEAILALSQSDNKTDRETQTIRPGLGPLDLKLGLFLPAHVTVVVLMTIFLTD